MPELLVGTLQSRADILLCNLVALMLRLDLHVRDVMDDPRRDTHVTATHPSLIRGDTIERAKLLSIVDNDRVYKQGPVAPIASSLCPLPSNLLELQRELPRQFRCAVVFLWDWSRRDGSYESV